jgi:hypothetical protein
MGAIRIVALGTIVIAGGITGYACLARAPGPPQHEGRSLGQRVWLKRPFYGCTDPEVAAKVTNLLSNNDFYGGIRTAIRGKCRHFNAGPFGVIKISSEPDGLVCIRPNSDGECFWLSDASLR